MKAVLHGTWVCDRDGRSDGSFFVWSERDVRVAQGSGAASRVQRHPYAATTIEIADLLSRYVPERDWRHATRLVRIAFLPSVDDGPVVPRWLYPGGQAPADEQPRLEAWRIEGIGIPILDMLGVLAVLPAADEERLTGRRVGADLVYWGLVAKFTLELLGRQRFLPGMRADDGGYVASWMPYLDDPADQARLAAFTRAMPPVCRAVLRERQGCSPEEAPTPYTALSSFVHYLVDEAVRTWSQDSPRSAELGLRSRSGKPLADRVGAVWWQALYTPDRTMKVPASKQVDLGRFYTAWQSWTYHARPESDVDYRLCFRLEPPDYDNGKQDSDAARWTLRYLLQSLDDPSLLIAASEVWRERGPLLGSQDARLDQAQERLLAGLARAGRVSPAIQRSLRSPNPEGTTLTVKEAYRFLRETSHLLEEMGFGVMVPPWWNKPDARLSVRARLRGKPEVEGEGALSMSALIAYDWELALGDETLTQEEFERLAELKTPLVKVRGRWVLLQPEQVEAAISFWERQRERSALPLHDALSLALGVEHEIDGLAVSALQVDGWLGNLLAALDGREHLDPVPTPQGFVGQLRPYQSRGLSWLAFLRRWGLSACLADDMGLGKTIQAIALLLHVLEQADGHTVPPALIVCPTSLVGNWAREIQRFAPALRVSVHHGAGRAEGDDLLQQSLEHDIVISTYGLVRRDLEDLGRVPWSSIILDEAQNIKNPLTKQARAVRRLNADYRLALTGTPIENRLSELWSIMTFLLPGYLGTLEGFRREFALPIERYQDEDAGERLRRLVRPFVLRRLKTDPLVIRDLPDKFEHRVYCNLTREQVTLYEAVVRDALNTLHGSEQAVPGIRRRGLVLAMLTRLKQVCDHPALFLADGSAAGRRSGKLNRLVEMLEEVLAVEDRALVFTQFAQMGHILQRHLQEVFGREVLFLHGGTPQHVRERMLQRFQEDDNAPSLFVLSLKAGGTGLNLMRANHVFHYDRWWNPAVENQATDRAYRIGQTRNVQVHKFLCPGTLEERIDQLIESKVALAENVVGAGESWLTELSTDELRDIITLRAEAIEDD